MDRLSRFIVSNSALCLCGACIRLDVNMAACQHGCRGTSTQVSHRRPALQGGRRGLRCSEPDIWSCPTSIQLIGPFSLSSSESDKLELNITVLEFLWFFFCGFFLCGFFSGFFSWNVLVLIPSVKTRKHLTSITQGNIH
jgi:hypothetical protein